jgi:hypothetical protein
MILYHGSNVEIEAIDFSKSKPGKDFGVGFYLSPDENQALEMAGKKARLLGGIPIVTRYEFDEEAVKADLPHLVRRTPTPLSLELSTV